MKISAPSLACHTTIPICWSRMYGRKDVKIHSFLKPHSVLAIVRIFHDSIFVCQAPTPVATKRLLISNHYIAMHFSPARGIAIYWRRPQCRCRDGRWNLSLSTDAHMHIFHPHFPNHSSHIPNTDPYTDGLSNLNTWIYVLFCVFSHRALCLAGICPGDYD